LTLGDYAVKAGTLFQQGKISEAVYFSYLNAIQIDPHQPLENGEE
jgi:hypothetical protein